MTEAPAPRRYSASGVGLYERCPRAWAYCYLDGLRTPEVPWEAIEKGAPATSKQRSLSLGTATHTAIETRYLGQPYDWSRLPGVIAKHAEHQLPAPDECEWFEVEGTLHQNDDTFASPEENDAQPLVVNGVTWNGRLDLVASAPRAWARLGLDRSLLSWMPVVLIDHKTSSNIARYAPTPTELSGMLQPNLYGLSIARRFDLARVQARWSYMQTGRTRKSEPRDFLIERSRAEDVVGKAAESAKAAGLLTSSAEAPCNTNACGDYGGCEYHHTAGGPCDARRSLGKLIQLRVKKPKPAETGNLEEQLKMSLTPEMQAKLAKFRKTAAPAAEEPAAEEPAEETAAEETPEEPAEETAAEEPTAAEPEPAPAPKRGPGRPPGSGTKTAAAKPPAAAKTAAVKPPATAKTAAAKPTGGTLSEMAAAYDEAVANAEALRAAMREMLGGE